MSPNLSEAPWTTQGGQRFLRETAFSSPKVSFFSSERELKASVTHLLHLRRLGAVVVKQFAGADRSSTRRAIVSIA